MHICIFASLYVYIFAYLHICTLVHLQRSQGIASAGGLLHPQPSSGFDGDAGDVVIVVGVSGGGGVDVVVGGGVVVVVVVFLVMVNLS